MRHGGTLLRATRWIGVLAVAAALSLGACSTPAGDRAPVLAAASLSNILSQLVESSPVPVELSFDGSNSLVDQVLGGAPADVLIVADTATKDRAVTEGIAAGAPVRFATNVMVLITPAGNPAGITGLDESLEGTRLVVCAPEVPCGRLTGSLANSAGVELDPVSEESGVTDVLGKVTSGEADAGVVYVTDALMAGDGVETLQIPGADDHVNEYWAMAVDGGDPDRAAAVVDLLTGEVGRRVLDQYGFGEP